MPNKPRKTLANIKPGDHVYLVYRMFGRERDESVEFLGFSRVGVPFGSEKDLPADLSSERKGALYAIFRGDCGDIFTAYKFDGRWAIGSSALRFSLEAV